MIPAAICPWKAIIQLRSLPGNLMLTRISVQLRGIARGIQAVALIEKFGDTNDLFSK
jgi:hypothetical protein